MMALNPKPLFLLYYILYIGFDYINFLIEACFWSYIGALLIF